MLQVYTNFPAIMVICREASLLLRIFCHLNIFIETKIYYSLESIKENIQVATFLKKIMSNFKSI